MSRLVETRRTRIPDWVAKLFGSKYSKRELEAKVASLQKRIVQLEKQP